MAWFDDLKTPRFKSHESLPVPGAEEVSSRIPEGLWTKCVRCGEILTTKVLRAALHVCPKCGHHHRLAARERIDLLCDPGFEFEEIAIGLVSKDPLEFDDVKPYKARLKASAKKTGLTDAFVAGRARLQGFSYFLGVFEFQFLGGSMGVVVGERITQLFEHALKEKLPAVVVSASGGARMQEGILSLMQMAKTTALLQEMRAQSVPYISVLTDPTTGGVAASFAMLGDVILAEPQALVGFAGPRVIEQTIRQQLPKGFQRSEFLLEHGFVDRVVPREQMAEELAFWMKHLGSKTCFTKKDKASSRT